MYKNKDISISTLLGIIIILIVSLVTVPLFYNQYNSSIMLLKEKTIDDFKDEEKITQIFINAELSLRKNTLREYVNSKELIDALEENNNEKVKSILEKGLLQPLDSDFLLLSFDDSENIIDVSLNILDSNKIVKEYSENKINNESVTFHYSERNELIIFLKERIISKNTGRVLGTLHSGYILNNQNKLVSSLSEKLNKHNVYFLANNSLISGTQNLNQTEIRSISNSKENQLIQVENKIFYIASLGIDKNNSLKVVFETSSSYIRTLKSSYISNFILTAIISITLCILTILFANKIVTPPLQNLISTMNLLMIRNMKQSTKRSIIKEFNIIEENFLEVYDKFQKQKAQHSKFIDASPLSVLILNYRGEIIQANNAAIKLFSISNTNGNIFKDSVLKSNKQFSEIFSTLKERKNFFEEDIIFKVNDTWRTTQWTFIQDKEDDSIFIQCIDYTEKVEAQAQIEAERSKSIHNQKLAAIGEVSSSVAHEINNPMGIISLSLTILEHELSFLEIQSEEKKKKIKTTIENIEVSITRTSQIISNLLDFSREGSKDKLETKNFSTVLSKTLIFIEEKLKKNKIILNTENLNKDINILIKETQFSQILVNLINNSIDALIGMPERIITISTEVKGDECFIHFVDTGKGISEEIERDIFSPFFSTKEKGKGTGLGLSISKDLIYEMSGELTLNRESSGAHFIIRVPLGRF